MLWIDYFYELYHLIKIRLVDIEIKYKIHTNLTWTIRTDTIYKLIFSFGIISIHFVQNLVVKCLYAKRVLTDFSSYQLRQNSKLCGINFHSYLSLTICREQRA